MIYVDVDSQGRSSIFGCPQLAQFLLRLSVMSFERKKLNVSMWWVDSRKTTSKSADGSLRALSPIIYVKVKKDLRLPLNCGSCISRGLQPPTCKMV